MTFFLSFLIVKNLIRIIESVGRFQSELCVFYCASFRLILLARHLLEKIGRSVTIRVSYINHSAKQLARC